MRLLRDLATHSVFLLGFGLGVLALAPPVAALAQSAAPALAQGLAPVTTVDAGSMFGQAAPTLEALAGVLASAIIGLLAYGVHRLIGVTIDAKMRAALQGALENAAHALIVAAEGKLDGKTIDVRSPEVADAIGYLRQFVPAALRRFKLDDPAIAELLRVQVAKLLPKAA